MLSSIWLILESLLVSFVTKELELDQRLLPDKDPQEERMVR